MNIFKEIKYFIQRGIRGYSDRDLWDFNYYLSSMLPKALRQLAGQTISYPCFQKGFTFEKWQKALNKMADGIEAYDIADDKFSKYILENKVDLYIKKMDIAKRKQDNALKLFVKYFNNLWD
jgi:hypothetical protein